MIKSLLTKLKAGSPNVQQIVAAEIRRLAKINDDYRVEIAFDEHKGRFEIVRAIPPLVRLLSEGSLHGNKDVASALHKSESGMKDEALALLDTLEPPGSEAAVLVNLCSGDQEYLIEAQGFGVRDILGDLQQNGTNRGKKKAGSC
ncbi:U-box domain-containing protein 13-like protein isoform X1 [Tanacetum coccineum]